MCSSVMLTGLMLFVLRPYSVESFFRTYFCLIQLWLHSNSMRKNKTQRWRISKCTVCLRSCREVPYLEGAVYKGFVQIDHYAVLAIVCYADLWQEELGWRLQRKHTHAYLMVSI